jgi:hypothetical protein
LQSIKSTTVNYRKTIENNKLKNDSKLKKKERKLNEEKGD